jgi:hypothetical protein
MASYQYTSYFNDVFKGNIDMDTDTFKVMLVTSSYTPSRNHTKRSDITNEVSGTGYTAGGNTATVTVSAVDTTNNRQDCVLGGTTWSTSTITARYAVYYKSRGGASSADELVGINDFGADVITTAGTFTLNSSTSRVTVS